MSDVAIYTAPNFEALTSFFLQAQDELLDYLPAGRIVTDMTGIKTWDDPAIRVVQFFDAAVTNRPHWLTRASLQVEAFAGAGGKHEAFLVAALARACMDARLVGVHSRGVVTDVATFGMQDAPDQTFEPARARWLFTAQVTGHPLSQPIS